MNVHEPKPASGKSDRIDLMLTALTVAVVSVFATVIFTHSSSEANVAESRLAVGVEFRVPGVRWDSKQTLVLALQPDCQYCSSSAPFYRDVVASRGQEYAVVVLSPYPEAANLEMLRVYGLDAPVYQVDFAALALPGTPTLVLVGENGEIRRTWVGLLSVEQERDVFDSLRVQRVAAGPGPKSPTPSVELEVLRTAETVLDTRTRDRFQAIRLPGSLNIPLDELEVRAERELRSDRPVLLICEFQGCRNPVTAARGTMPTWCQAAEMVLRERGFTSVSYVETPLEELERHGLALLRNPKPTKG